MPCGYGTVRTTRVRINHQVSHISKKHFRPGRMAVSEWTRSVRAIRDTPVADYSAPDVNTACQAAYCPPIAVLRFCGFVVLRFCGFAVLRFCGFAVLRFCGFAVLRFCGFAGLRFCGFAVSSRSVCCKQTLWRCGQL
jgi:hypothetical protein